MRGRALFLKCLVLTILIILVVPHDVWRDLRNLPRHLAYERKQRETEQWNRRPPADLAIRVEDYRRFPREGFGFVITNGVGQQIDTFRGTVTRDLIANPDTTIVLDLTPAEMDSVYRAMIAMRFFELPEPYPPFSSRTGVDPYTTVTFEARAGGSIKRLSWSTRMVNERPSDDWKRLNRLMRMIWNMVERKPEWQALPQPKGGYL